jgi:hypothetical protein
LACFGGMCARCAQKPGASRGGCLGCAQGAHGPSDQDCPDQPTGLGSPYRIQAAFCWVRPFSPFEGPRHPTGEPK